MSASGATRHDFDRVEYDESYTLVCTCGWRSTPSESAAEIGKEWDDHRSRANRSSEAN